MSNKEFKRWITRQRLLLAIYFHAPDDKPWSAPSSRKLMKEVGVKQDALRTAMRDLEAGGKIIIPPPELQSQGTTTTIVLADHPDAEDFVKYLETRFDEGREPERRGWSRNWEEADREYERQQSAFLEQGQDADQTS